MMKTLHHSHQRYSDGKPVYGQIGPVMKHQCQSQLSPEHASPEVHGAAGYGTRQDEPSGSVGPRLTLMRTRTSYVFFANFPNKVVCTDIPFTDFATFKFQMFWGG